MKKRTIQSKKLRVRLFFLAVALMGMMMVACERETESEGDTSNTEETMPEQEGLLQGEFSVAEGRKVRFSQGNLQYQASTGIWKFAESQLEYVGEGNRNRAEDYSGWIDLFPWGTSGWNSGARCYMPWDDGDPDHTGCTSGADFVPDGNYAADLTGEYANADWGVYNAISNGGNQAGMWRTLTIEEWEYLLRHRSASTIGETENARFARINIDGLNGLMLFPNNFNMPDGITVPQDINVATFVCIDEPGFTNNTYTAGEWQRLENAGAVFLVASCSRSSTSVVTNNEYGAYWSATHKDDYRAHDVTFFKGYMNEYSWANRPSGQSVRLVRDVE